MANETNSRENVGGAGLMDALMGGAMGEELPSAADGDDLLRLALSSTGIGPVDTPLDTPVDDSVFLEVDPLTVTAALAAPSPTPPVTEVKNEPKVAKQKPPVQKELPKPKLVKVTEIPAKKTVRRHSLYASSPTVQKINTSQYAVSPQPISLGTPVYIANGGVTGSTSHPQIQIINPQTQIIQLAPNQLLDSSKIPITSTPNTPTTPQIIYANHQGFPTSQYILQPLNLPPISSSSTTPQRMVIKSTPSGLIQGEKLQRRQSLQPLSTSQQNTIVRTTFINHSAVPGKTQLQPLKVPATVDVISQIESDQSLSAREKLIKVRQEMRRRYELLRQASEMRRDETFQKYRAAKIRGKPHPDPVIESMALASVTVPDVTLEFDLPNRIIQQGILSDLQLEAVMYSKQQHASYYPSGERKGFLLGDGAGVGKGRTIAGIILDNWNQGRTKAIWLSVSNDLRQDAERDLADVGAGHIKVHAFHKFKYGARLADKENGSIKDGVIFGTYASLIGERHHDKLKTTRLGKTLKSNQATRLHQLLTWCGSKFDGLIVFDECHKAKNLYQANGKPSKTGHTVLELQKSLKHARVVYASATGASEPKHMSYMSRIGLWGAGTGFRNSEQFIDALTKAGVGAMELVAMDMKRRGVYLARQLSFEGCSFELDEVPLDNRFVEMYDKCVELWNDAKEYFHRAATLMGDDFKMPGMWQQYWAAHQRFFKYLCMSAKVPHVVRVARQAQRNDKCVIIGLQSTGEQRTSEEIDRKKADGEEIDDMVSSCKGVFRTLLERHFPVSNRSKLQELGFVFDFDKQEEEYEEDEVTFEESDDEEDVAAVFGDDDEFSSRKKDTTKRKRKRVDSMSEHFKAAGFKMRRMSALDEKIEKQEKANQECTHLLKTLLDKLEKLSPYLPGNALDELMDGLGGPDMVAEMTGRRNRLVITDQGVKYENRAGTDGVALENINLTEKDHFMQGRKPFAVISDAASSGISLHADRRVPNLRKRVHITLELPWSADKAVQQFGRSHRSNQVHPPEYVFLISELAGEQRFASVVARRLECMGALTHGDRHSAAKQQDLSKFNFDTPLGKKALDTVLKSILGEQENIVQTPSFYAGNFIKDMCRALLQVGVFTYRDEERKRIKIDGDVSISKFLNRLLGMEMAVQQALFQYFSDTLDDIIEEAKTNGTYEEGILDIGNANDKIEVRSKDKFWIMEDTSLDLIKVHDYRGVEWEEVRDMRSKLNGQFYIAKSGKMPFMFYPKADKYVCIRPNQSIVENAIDMDSWRNQLRLEKEPEKDEEKISKLWKACYKATKNNCQHEYEKGTCVDNERVANSCMIGKRCLEIFLLCGPILSVWSHIQDIIHRYDKNASIQVVRLKTTKGKRLVGLLIPNNCVEGLGEGLAKLVQSRPQKTPRRPKKIQSVDPQLQLDEGQGPTEDELNRLAAEVFENEGDIENGELNGETENGDELDPDQEAALERLAQEAMMENDFTF